MRIACQGRLLLWACLGYFAATAAFAGTPAHDKTPKRDKAQEQGMAQEKDRTWTALIEQAKAHGGVETKLDKSASYVFQQKDGTYISFTRLLATNKGRSVCLK